MLSIKITDKSIEWSGGLNSHVKRMEFIGYYFYDWKKKKVVLESVLNGTHLKATLAIYALF